MIARAALVLPAIVLLAACGDSLESRNEAAGLDQRGGSEMTVVTQNTPPSRSGQNAATRSPNAQPTSQSFSDEEGEDDDVLEVDAGPETFVDSAEGFAPEPMDDTSGFDPSPMDFAAGEAD